MLQPESADWSVVGSTYNWIEVVLWGLIAAILGLKSLRQKPGNRAIPGIAAAAFAVFSWSDYIEISTGSWWEPCWLAATKISCVAVMAFTFWIWRRRSTPTAPDAGPR